MVKKGDRLELVNAGTSWYQVKVGEKVGWVERKAGFLVDESSSVTNLLFAVLGILVLTGAVFGVSVYIKKQKPS
jgi:phosphate/sulfate permease